MIHCELPVVMADNEAICSSATNESKLSELLSRATTLFGTTSVGSSSIDEFCQLVKSEPEGPQITLRLLAHKLQSPVESEAMAALDVLQRCVESCGPSFHAEIGKFRFLNEIVKVISPKVSDFITRFLRKLPMVP